MDEFSLADREMAAFMAGAEAEMVELRGYGLTADERAETLEEAVAIYGGGAETASPVASPVAA